MQLLKHHHSRPGQAVLALLLIALVLLLDAMMVSPPLHERFHPDAGEHGHQCAVTLFAHGQVDAAAVDVAMAGPLPWITPVPVTAASVFCPVIEQLPAGRAPPVAAFHS